MSAIGQEKALAKGLKMRKICLSKLTTESATKLLTADGILAYEQKNTSSLRKVCLLSK